jgi:hypothetical protein
LHINSDPKQARLSSGARSLNCLIISIVRKVYLFLFKPNYSKWNCIKILTDKAKTAVYYIKHTPWRQLFLRLLNFGINY